MCWWILVGGSVVVFDMVEGGGNGGGEPNGLGKPPVNTNASSPVKLGGDFGR